MKLTYTEEEDIELAIKIAEFYLYSNYESFPEGVDFVGPPISAEGSAHIINPLMKGHYE